MKRINPEIFNFYVYLKTDYGYVVYNKFELLCKYPICIFLESKGLYIITYFEYKEKENIIKKFLDIETFMIYLKNRNKVVEYKQNKMQSFFDEI